ncbi:hypothetical protein B5M42_008855 [Paenibacillus athensensis]|uniref:Uncharacterized protein n=1 Tax=Paenibacillus athensensis TaxID=1967502 RepID=A0A4Y8Q983_9BACL|nr:hypothetical protein [Paenibacillus athensensis]MCD1258945.1 hypothetical protein [Paenibacillus athensensis]
MKKIIFAIACIAVVLISLNLFKSPSKLQLKVEPTLVPPVLSNTRNSAAEATPASSGKAAAVISAEAFIAGFNQTAKDNGLSLVLPDGPFEDKGDHLAYSHPLSAKLTLVALINSADHTLRGITLLGSGDNPAALDANAVALIDASVAAAAPQLAKADRDGVLAKLGLKDDAAIAGLDATADANGVSFSVTGSDAVGMLFAAALE